MLKTPYYLIDKAKLLPNMEKIAWLRENSGAKSLLALKCFATWSVFDLMREYMDGTTSSSLYEVKLGREKFGKETHAYSVAYGDDEIGEVVDNCDKIIFNTINQLERFDTASSSKVRGLRVNPRVSTSEWLISDPAGRIRGSANGMQRRSRPWPTRSPASCSITTARMTISIASRKCSARSRRISVI